MVLLIKYVVFAISLLPLGVARGVGAVVGLCAWRVKSRAARITLANLGACFPEKTENEIKALARNSMKHWGMTLFEIPVVWRKGRKSLDWIKSIRGEALVEKIRTSPHGVMFVSPHLGNWEMMGYWGASQGRMTTLYQPPRRFDLDELLIAARKKTGAALVPTNVKGVAQLVKALKKGEFIGILPDMEPELSSGVFAPFFGVPALTMTLIHNLRQRTGAMILLCFARRVRGGFELVLSELEYDADSDVAPAVAALNRGIEELVMQAPEQYQWEYKRFKRRPEGNARLYK